MEYKKEETFFFPVCARLSRAWSFEKRPFTKNYDFPTKSVIPSGYVFFFNALTTAVANELHENRLIQRDEVGIRTRRPAQENICFFPYEFVQSSSKWICVTVGLGYLVCECSLTDIQVSPFHLIIWIEIDKDMYGVIFYNEWIDIISSQIVLSFRSTGFLSDFDANWNMDDKLSKFYNTHRVHPVLAQSICTLTRILDLGEENLTNTTTMISVQSVCTCKILGLWDKFVSGHLWHLFFF